MAAIKAVAKVESGGTIAFDTHYRARILFEVFARRKLERIHEDRNDERRGFCPAETDEGEMALVQSPHGRHEGDVAFRTPLRERCPELR